MGDGISFRIPPLLAKGRRIGRFDRGVPAVRAAIPKLGSAVSLEPPYPPGVRPIQGGHFRTSPEPILIRLQALWESIQLCLVPVLNRSSPKGYRKPHPA
jgi:hypothetical protein